jgi:hypothetical protein
MTKCRNGEHVFGPWEDVDSISKEDEQKKRQCSICGQKEKMIISGGESSPIVVPDDDLDVKK